MIAGGGREALMFVGRFEWGLDEGGVEEDAPAAKALLHIGKDWVVLSGYEPGLWEMDDIDARLLGTWAGSDEMLTRAVKYILSDEQADVPVKSNVDWGRMVLMGKLAGKIHDARAVDLAGDGAAWLFIAADGGDQLLRYDPAKKAGENVTVKRKLASTSRAAAWSDFNRDGRCDLASWDGRGLSLHLQQADGTFQAKRPAIGQALKAGCTRLATLDCGAKGVALLASTPAGPFLLVIDKQGKVAAT
ncbi:unnamed protein product, partial [marine sediment metagenome]